MKIAFVVLKAMPFGGGIEKYTEEVGARLASWGHEVVVYTMGHYSGSEGSYRGMRLIKVPCLKARSIEKLSAAFVATLHACIKERPDLIHFQHSPCAVYFPLALAARVRFTMQSHGIAWGVSRWSAPGRLLLRALDYFLAYSPSPLAVVSRSLQRHFMGKFGRQTLYIPTGVNPPEHVPPGALLGGYGLRGNDYILYVGRLSREKGVHYLLRAFVAMGQDKYRLVLTGEEPNDTGYREELEDIGRGNRGVIFTGYRGGRELSELMSNCRLFVLPSEVEGLPTVLLEAMSHGAACLVSDIPENLEALSGLGYSFRARDAQSLREAMAGLLEDEEAIRKFSSLAPAHVLKDHSWDGIARNFEAMFKAETAR